MFSVPFCNLQGLKSRERNLLLVPKSRVLQMVDRTRKGRREGMRVLRHISTPIPAPATVVFASIIIISSVAVKMSILGKCECFLMRSPSEILCCVTHDNPFKT